MSRAWLTTPASRAAGSLTPSHHEVVGFVDQARMVPPSGMLAKGAHRPRRFAGSPPAARFTSTDVESPRRTRSAASVSFTLAAVHDIDTDYNYDCQLAVQLQCESRTALVNGLGHVACGVAEDRLDEPDRIGQPPCDVMSR